MSINKLRRRDFIQALIPILSIPIGLGALLTGFASQCAAQTAVVEAESTTEAAAETKPANLPEAKKILEDHLAATGGREKFKTLKSMVMNGELEIKALGAKADLEVFQTDKNQFLFRTNIPQIGEIQKCMNGDLAWEKNPVMGTRIIEGEEAKSMEREADIASQLHPEKYYKRMECVGEEEINGSKCYKVEMETNEGETETNFYDAESKMMVRMIRKQKTPMGDIKMTVDMSDFRESGGMTFPFLTETAYMGQKEVMKIKSVEPNGTVDESVFETPEDVTKLIEKAKAKKAEKAAKDEAEKAEATDQEEAAEKTE